MKALTLICLLVLASPARAAEPGRAIDTYAKPLVDRGDGELDGEVGGREGLMSNLPQGKS